MRKTLLAAGLATGVALVCSQSAGAVPAGATTVKQAAAAASPVERVQYVQRRTKHGMVKCYRYFVIGPYRCHYYRNGTISFPF